MARRKKRKKRRINKAGEMLYGHYLVAFLDLMGQRENIRKMRVPVTGGEEARKEVLEYLKETAGKVSAVRDMVLETVRLIGKPSHVRKELPLDTQAVMDRITEPRIRVMRFSDTIVLFMPMAGESVANTAVNVYGMLAAVAFALVTSFAGGVPLRGGIDIGAGINIEKDEVYGAALERAYALENTFADYPRVLVGHELLNYLTMLSGSHPQCSEDQLAKTFGRLASTAVQKRITEVLGRVRRGPSAAVWGGHPTPSCDSAVQHRTPAA
ncbi:hypothetical protein [Deferrisoma palaeochoriense]